MTDEQKLKEAFNSEYDYKLLESIKPKETNCCMCGNKEARYSDMFNAYFCGAKCYYEHFKNLYTMKILKNCKK